MTEQERLELEAAAFRALFNTCAPGLTYRTST